MRQAMLLILLSALSPWAAAQDRSDDAQIVAALHRACEAYRTGDVEFLEGFLADNYTLTDSRGNVTRRDADLAQVRAGDPRYEVFENRDMDVRLYGDAAVVTGITSVKGTSGGEPFKADFQFTDTMIKRDGRWQIAASHISRRE